MSARPLIVVGSQSFVDHAQDWAIHKYDGAANPYPHGHHAPNHGYFLAAITGIALDSTGDLIVCTQNTAWPGTTGYDDQPATFPSEAYVNAAYPQWTLRRYNPDGQVRWQANHGAACHDVALDAAGNVYVVGDPVNAAGQVWTSGSRTGFYTTRQYDSSGTLQWSADHGYCQADYAGGYPLRIAVDPSGHVYTAGSTTAAVGAVNLTQYNASGVVQWSVLLATGWTSYVLDVVADATGVYLAGVFNNTYILMKYDPDGDWVASASRPATSGGSTGAALCWDSAGDLIVGLRVLYGTYAHLFKYAASDLSLLESQAPVDYWNSPIRGIAIDADDVVYVAAGTRLVAYSTASAFGAEVWGSTPVIRDDDASPLTAYCVAVAEIDQAPALALPLRLGLPTWIGDFYAHIPALPLNVALGAPGTLREYVGPPQPECYRLIVTGTPDLELPMAFCSLRSTTDGIRLMCVIPGVTAALWEAIAARSSGDLILHRVYRLPDGGEQWEVMTQTAFESVYYDAGSTSASVTLLGRSPSIDSGHAKTRRVRGGSYRASTDGQRRLRCEVDPYVRVGDTADLGDGETWVIGAITLTLSATSALMEWAE